EHRLRVFYHQKRGCGMKCVFSLLVVLCLSAGMASADYYGPPGWDSNPYFTHQSWSLSRGLPLGAANGADPGYINPAGMPLATRLAGTWLNDLGMGRQGGWSFAAGTTGLLASISVPNIPDPDLRKELWFQATIKTNDIGDLGLGIDVYDDQGNPFSLSPANLVIDPFAVDGGATWAHVTGLYSIAPQPIWESVVLTGALGPNEYLIIDQIDVDTRCVPEPSTVAMLLGGGLLAVLRWRRRR
ncbi:MAG: PEP-CTERM sorting domain-containing protein, partial [Planctomycetia bacterium]|nr:PEP-CTERM sorting domain-containing protein [Planctomycetia bacterium]